MVDSNDRPTCDECGSTADYWSKKKSGELTAAACIEHAEALGFIKYETPPA